MSCAIKSEERIRYGGQVFLHCVRYAKGAVGDCMLGSLLEQMGLAEWRGFWGEYRRFFQEEKKTIGGYGLHIVVLYANILVYRRSTVLYLVQ